MINPTQEIIIRALIDGREDNCERDSIMLVPPENTNNPGECIYYTNNGFRHVSTNGIESVSKNNVRQHAQTWQIVSVNI